MQNGSLIRAELQPGPDVLGIMNDFVDEVVARQAVTLIALYIVDLSGAQL